MVLIQFSRHSIYYCRRVGTKVSVSLVALIFICLFFILVPIKGLILTILKKPINLSSVYIYKMQTQVFVCHQINICFNVYQEPNLRINFQSSVHILVFMFSSLLCAAFNFCFMKTCVQVYFYYSSIYLYVVTIKNVEKVFSLELLVS